MRVCPNRSSEDTGSRSKHGVGSCIAMQCRFERHEERQHMDPVTNELRLLLEREKIRDCIARLARGEDRRDAGLIRASYWPDSTTDYGDRKSTRLNSSH